MKTIMGVYYMLHVFCRWRTEAGRFWSIVGVYAVGAFCTFGYVANKLREIPDVDQLAAIILGAFMAMFWPLYLLMVASLSLFS